MASLIKNQSSLYKGGKIKRHLNYFPEFIRPEAGFPIQKKLFSFTHSPSLLALKFKQAILSSSFINAIPTANNTVVVMISYY
jgi:hypothetical protein